ncbi:sensor histidine kinase [Rhodospirillum sp. A1_3_36]|uniref:sensor histidine kinase n=1 Tax=Rhodospirillum sp. A1_3_36 TaxID=3391666 RepID=UPI0039A6504A
MGINAFKRTAPRRFSLRRRLLVRMATGFVLIIGLAAVALWTYARNAANGTYDLLLNGAALAILERSYVLPGGTTVDIPYSALEMLGLAPDDRVFYRIFLDTGVTLTGESELPMAGNLVPSTRPRYVDASWSGEEVRFIFLGRRLPGGGDARWIIAQVGHTRLARDALERSLITNGLAMLVFLSLVGLAFVGLGINRALAPLNAIEQDLSRREPTDMTPLAAMPPREVEALISAINGFIQRLAVNQQHTQTFIADVAHQTRTALGALQGTLDSASRQSDPEALANRLARAQDQANRTARLTNQLLAHAMVIHRGENTPLQAVDLVALARAVLEDTLRHSLSSDLEYGLETTSLPKGGAWIAGDPVSLREALRNLLDNAAKHGPLENRVDITLYREAAEGGGMPVIGLLVEDAGPGIRPDRREAALERFRSMGSEAGNGTGQGAGTGRSGQSSGLGLAIVRAVAQAHGAQLTLGESRLGGLAVDIRFPEGPGPGPGAGPGSGEMTL